MSTTKITLQELAEKLNGKYWAKDDLKRIYLDKGYNTKKMSTKTYVYQREDGSFGVKCYIDCPSQAWQWIESQQNEVIEGVYEDIEEALADTVYLIQDDETKLFNGLTDDSFEEIDNCTNNFLSEEKAQEFLEEEIKDAFSNKGKNFSVIKMDKVEFETTVDKWWEKRKKEQEKEDALKATAEKVPAKIDEIRKPETKDDKVILFGVDSKVKHARFGVGTVTSEDDTKIEIDFPEHGKKNLLKQFVKLTLVKDENQEG